MRKKNYLITGGAGFIGSAIIRRLLKRNVNITCLDSNIRGSFKKLKNIKKRIKIVKSDIRNFNSLDKVSKNIDCVVHLAFLNGTKFFYSNPDLVLDIGVKGILNIIDVCKKNKIPELILASSSEVYQLADKIPTDEKVVCKIPDVLNPRYSYAGGKLISEIIALNNSNIFKRLLIFRPHNVYGPDMGYEHVIPQFIKRIQIKSNKHRKKIKFLIQGNGNETRSFNYIDDFVDGFLKILDKGRNKNIYNIGTQEEIKISSLAKLVAKKMGYKINIVKSKKTLGSTNRRCPDIKKLKKLGYKPKIMLDLGIKKTIDWYNSNKN